MMRGLAGKTVVLKTGTIDATHQSVLISCAA